MATGHRDLIAYLRVSSEAQDTQLQRDALGEAGCVKFFQDKISSRKADRRDWPRPWSTSAAASPAIVRWWIMSRSSSANAAMTVNKNLPSPVGVYVPASVPGQDA